MRYALDRVEKESLAEHIKEAKVFRIEQQTILEKNAQANNAKLLTKLEKLLCVNADELNHHMRDQNSNSKLRHPGTCEWIFQNDEFLRWSKISAVVSGQNPLLWITGGPGVGKTVLTSAVIDHFLKRNVAQESEALLYYYFKGTSQFNKTPLSAVRSFLYQLLGQIQQSPDIDSEFQDSFGMSFGSLWYKCRLIIEKMPWTTIILDGIDECEGFTLLMESLQDKDLEGKMKVLVVSRRERFLLKKLTSFDVLEIEPQDIQRDIKTYVEHKIKRNPRLSHPLVLNLVEEKLIHSNNGMFLWVRLVLKELKACLSLEQIIQTLTETPTALDAIYTTILRRLELELQRPAVGMARKVLTWTVTCARPISYMDLSMALSYQYQLEGHTLLFDDVHFPYSEKDIEAMCGSLVVIRDGQVELAHYTVKNFFMNTSRGVKCHTGSDVCIFPDFPQASYYLAKVCVAFVAEYAANPSAPISRVIPSGRSVGSHHPDRFLGYACLHWIFHALDCPLEYRDMLAQTLVDHMGDPEIARSWLEKALTLDRRGLWRLVIGVEDLQALLVERREMGDAANGVYQAYEWCTRILICLDDYGTAFTRNPTLMQTLQLELMDVKGGEERVHTTLSTTRREAEESYYGLNKLIDKDIEFERTHLGYEEAGHFNLWKAQLGFFVYEPNQRLFFSGEHYTGALGSNDAEWLYGQDAETGRRLPPVIKTLKQSQIASLQDGDVVLTTRLSQDGRFFVIAYSEHFSVWVIEPVQGKIPTVQRLKRQDWATRLILSPYVSSDSPRSPITESGAPIVAISKDNRLFVPGGSLKLPSRELEPFEPFGEGVCSPKLTPMVSNDASHFFYLQVDPSCLKIHRHTESSLVTPPDPIIIHDTSASTLKPSYTGAWVVLFSLSQEQDPMVISLVECSTSRRYDIATGKTHFGYESFHFSENDDQLVTFLMIPHKRHSVFAKVVVTVWDLSFKEPKIRSEGSIEMAVKSCSSWGVNRPHFTFKSASLALIVTCDRSVYTVQLRPLVSFPGHEVVRGYTITWGGDSSIRPPEPRSIRNFDRMFTRISEDGQQVASVYVRPSEVQVIVLKFSLYASGGTYSDKTYRLPTTDDTLQDVPVLLTRSFDILVAGAYVFMTDREASIPIKLDIDFNPHQNRDYYWENINWKGTQSKCGNFIAFWTTQRVEENKLAVFSIDRQSSTASRLSILPLTSASCKELDITALSIDFHSDLPIAIFAYSFKAAYRGNNYGPKVGELLTAKVHFVVSPSLDDPPLRRLQCAESVDYDTQEQLDPDLQLRRNLKMESIR
jgi:hypothetical protein